jgi:hypothetical protein
MPPFEQRRPRFNHRILCSLSDSLIQFFGSLQHCLQPSNFQDESDEDSNQLILFEF